MRYETLSDGQERLLFLIIRGDVSYEPLQACFSEVDEILRYSFHYRLIIDGDQISRFNISNEVCQQIAPKLFNFARRAAFFSQDALTFGMARVLQAYSFNDNFGVFRNLEEARMFVEAGRTSKHLMCH